MAISFTRYIDITSGVGAATIVPRRDFVGRLFTDNNLLPPESFISFSTATEVASYFGSSSEEYLRALYYFNFISKNITSPQTIQFARWVNVDVAPRIYGISKTQILSTFTAITAGSFGLTIGSTVHTFSGLDFSGAASLSAVAAIIQAAINAQTGVMWTAATVVWDASTSNFNFVGGSAITTTISVQEGVGGTPIAGIIGWLPQSSMVNGVFISGAIWANGSVAVAPEIEVSNSAGASNNFGTFLFMQDLTLDQAIAVATWNNEQNVLFKFEVSVTLSNYAAWTSISTGLGGIGGTCIALESNNPNEYFEMLDMMIEASTDYSATNSVQNYMFQQFNNATANVTTDSLANALDAVRVNYYGQTQTAGQLLSFYQRGVMQGSITDPLDSNVYANEQWLKDAAGASIMNLLLTLSKISANNMGRSQILSVLQDVINEAKNNGVISVGKSLNTDQKLFIAEITNQANAWFQVQNSGCWLNCVITSSGSPLQYKAKYILVYSKDDDIRSVQGTHILI